ncbi:MAG: TIGR02300 family protein [Acetobacteraceae bacterium]|nr:TIGR02300 family protein [Acetobacteraceae bacterium]
MAKPELGLKRVCVACGTKFYDLTRSPAICPKCGTEQPAEQPRLRRGAPGVEDKLKKRIGVGPLPEGEIEEVGLEDVEAEDAALEDAEELEDDTESLAEDIEVEPDRDEET